LSEYQVSYDSTNAIIIEPITGRVSNILDVPQGNQRDISKGQPLEDWQIVASVPVPSGLSKINFTLFNESSIMVEDLISHFDAVALGCVDIESDSNSFATLSLS
jgi:hypothetical protein